MTTLDEYIEQQLADPEFARAWEDSEDEYRFRLALIEARQSIGMTQAELARKTGMKQNAISRIETGETNPTLGTLHRLAQGMGRHLKIEFV
ncbi:MAG: helix-turn-helix transcriptional regulator [Coriobacteriales bacterium]